MSGETRPFFAWPGRELYRTLPLCAIFAALFAVSYSGASWWTSRYASLPAWNLPFESRIPFVPSLAIVYLTITPALMFAPFVFRTRSEIVPLVCTLCAETLIATACFLAFPQTTAFVRPPVPGWIGAVFNFADALNLQFNQFPSLHVAFASTAAWAYSRRSGMPGKLLWAGWTAAVATSAWLIREHHLVDLAGGFVLAMVCVRVLYRKLERPEARQAIWVDLCCLWQCARFSARHPRYFVIFLAIYVPSLAKWSERRVVRVAFCTAQWIDDLLDGDRALRREPLESVGELLDQMESRAFTWEPLSRLTGALFDELDALRVDGDDPHSEFIALVREMQRDRKRAIGRELWIEEELSEHHRRTFHYSVNLMLISARCRARATDVPALIDALGWCSTFRDLEDDLAHGLINVPRNVVERANATSNRQSLDVIRASSAFRAWALESQRRAEQALVTSAQQLERLDDARGGAILQRFHASIVRFARRQRQLNSSLFAAEDGATVALTTRIDPAE